MIESAGRVGLCTAAGDLQEEHFRSIVRTPQGIPLVKEGQPEATFSSICLAYAGYARAAIDRGCFDYDSDGIGGRLRCPSARPDNWC